MARGLRPKSDPTQRTTGRMISSANAADDRASGAAKALTLAAMSLGFGVVQLDVTIVNTALTSIGSSLGGGVSELQWVVSAYTIAFAALILTAGALGDRLGAKKVFIAGLRSSSSRRWRARWPPRR
jgi:MFS transporter, DHA2 family, methylenomycin A resistance protein